MGHVERQAASAPQSLPVNTSAPGLASQLSTEVSADESDDKVAVGGDR